MLGDMGEWGILSADSLTIICHLGLLWQVIDSSVVVLHYSYLSQMYGRSQHIIFSRKQFILGKHNAESEN